MTVDREVVLQRESGRTVTLEYGGSTVRKTFHGKNSALLTRLAAREFDRMLEFNSALRHIEFATCPRPIELGTDPEPFIRMERASGIPLEDHLARSAWDSVRYNEASEVLQQALVEYVVAFAEPYWDFIFRNMFYDENTKIVTFLDFGIPTLYGPALNVLQRHSAMDVSLGALLGSSLFDAARPKKMFRLRQHRQARVLAGAVFTRCNEASEGLPSSIQGAAAVARTTYRLAASDGGWVRRAWYDSGGRLLARPSVQLDRLLQI